MTKIMDRGYSWVICGVTFSCYFLQMIGISAFGILYPEFIDHFSSSNAQTAIIGSLNSAVGAISGLMLNPIIPQVGCRPIAIVGGLIGAIGYAGCFFAESILHLCIGFGVLGGLANGMLLFSSSLILHHYFDQRRTLAAAIATCGASAASLSMPPITRWLISCLGWRTTTLVLGAIFLQSAICGALMRPNNHDKHKHKPMGNDEKSGESVHSSEVCCDPCITRGASWFARSIWTSLDVTIFRNPRFLLMMIGSCLSVFGYMIPCVFIPSLAVTSLDMNPYKSALLLSVWAASTIVGRISSGLIVDRLPFFKSPDRRVYMYAVPNIFCGLCTATVYVIRSQDAFIFYCILFGFLTGSYVSSQQPVLVDLFGMEDLSKTLAFFFLFNGIACLLCQPFAGWLVDLSGAFRLAFLVNGLIQAFSGFLLFALVFLGPPKSKTTQNIVKETDVEPASVTSSLDSSLIDSNGKDTSFKVSSQLIQA